MLYYTVGQWRIFVTMVAAGALAGAWYALMARVARALDAGAWLNAFFDLMIALGVWTIVCAGLLAANYGEVRLYALSGAALGFFAYQLTVKRLVDALLGAVSKIARKLRAWLCKRSLMKKIFR
ncbi:spore cortex biosynthesis protein YabQ [Bacillota bacterium Meth-B3]|nr:spore cortex biosynthesis protein YabQ [Christensenellaceae bacterium]MEA5068875.1 spore cortex biosynthesis protein YabQ [Christensenellaceae bacterium]